MAAEHHEAKAPAMPGDEDGECEQQRTGAENSKRVCRLCPQGPADDIALLAARRKRQCGETRQAQHKSEQVTHPARSLEATAIGARRLAARLYRELVASRDVRIASTA